MTYCCNCSNVVTLTTSPPAPPLVVGTPSADTFANPVIAKFGTSLVATLEDELLDRLEDEKLEDRLEEDSEVITLTLEEELLDELLEDRLDEDIDELTVDETDEELLLDELLIAIDDEMLEEVTRPQLPATALPPTVIESILAISWEPVARIRRWFTPATRLTFLVTLLQLDKEVVRGNDKLPEEPFTVRPALVEPILA